MSKYPKRGDVFISLYDPRTDSTSDWPVVIIQNNVGNEHARTIIVAEVVEGSEPTFDLEVQLSTKESGLLNSGIVRTDRIYTIPKDVLKEKTGALSAETNSKINEALSISLGLIDF